MKNSYGDKRLQLESTSLVQDPVPTWCKVLPRTSLADRFMTMERRVKDNTKYIVATADRVRQWLEYLFLNHSEFIRLRRLTVCSTRKHTRPTIAYFWMVHRILTFLSTYQYWCMHMRTWSIKQRRLYQSARWHRVRLEEDDVFLCQIMSLRRCCSSLGTGPNNWDTTAVEDQTASVCINNSSHTAEQQAQSSGTNNTIFQFCSVDSIDKPS